ncbi:TPA: flavodoxin family protein, partial [Clostridioides difficile]|nr:flavodoxin family protein [Clostridioides difficile]
MDSNDKKGLKSPEIIIINGSPRINKNCSFIANEVKAMLEE